MSDTTMPLHVALSLKAQIAPDSKADLTTRHKAAQKADLYNGFSKTYETAEDGGEVFPPEGKKVVNHAEAILTAVAEGETDRLDWTLTVDAANMEAKADVVVDGETLLSDVPVPFLLYLEGQLVHYRTFVNKMPTLDVAQDWTKDPNSDLFKTAPTQKRKTRRETDWVVVVPPTTEHPAQVKEKAQDVVIGHWTEVKHSGALPVPRKDEILRRIDKVLRAVKKARGQANSIEVEKQEAGAKLFKHIFG